MSEHGDSPLNAWKRAVCSAFPGQPKILLTGALQWEGSVHLDYRQHCPSGLWITSDVQAGDGVQMVADLHAIGNDHPNEFQAIFCPATLEHLSRPWRAMCSMAMALASRGCLFIQTHQTFPLHGYPNDYFRFSTDALGIMCRDAGLDVLAAGYDFPCTITPVIPVDTWNQLAPCYLNVSICAQKQ